MPDQASGGATPSKQGPKTRRGSVAWADPWPQQDEKDPEEEKEEEAQWTVEEAQLIDEVQQGRENLVIQWREVCRPRGQGRIAPQPKSARDDFEPLFARWLEERGLMDAMHQEQDQRGWLVYKYSNSKVVPGTDWEQAFHGTWWYAVWLILDSGVLLESNDKASGHDFWEPGVYCTPVLETARWYARPHVLFGDGAYHRVLFELRVDPERRKRQRQRGGVQWVFNSSAVSIHAVWVEINAPPDNGEERVNEWDPELEALPSGRCRPEPVLNPRDFASDPWCPDESEEEEEERPDPAARQPPPPLAPALGRPQAAPTRAGAYTRLRLDGYGSGASFAPRPAAPAGLPPPPPAGLPPPRREERGSMGAEHARLIVPSLPPRTPPRPPEAAAESEPAPPVPPPAPRWSDGAPEDGVLEDEVAPGGSGWVILNSGPRVFLDYAAAGILQNGCPRSLAKGSRLRITVGVNLMKRRPQVMKVLEVAESSAAAAGAARDEAAGGSAADAGAAEPPAKRARPEEG